MISVVEGEEEEDGGGEVRWGVGLGNWGEELERKLRRRKRDYIPEEEKRGGKWKMDACMES